MISSSAPSLWSRGFSLIEAAIVLGIVGLVIGGIWIAAASVRTAHKINEANTLFLGALSVSRDHMAVLNSQTAGTDTNIEELMYLAKLPGNFTFNGGPFPSITGNGLYANFIWTSQRGLWAAFAFMNSSGALQADPKLCIGITKNLAKQKYWSQSGFLIFYVDGVNSGLIDMNSGTPVDPADIINYCKTANSIWAQWVLP